MGAAASKGGNDKLLDGATTEALSNHDKTSDANGGGHTRRSRQPRQDPPSVSDMVSREEVGTTKEPQTLEDTQRIAQLEKQLAASQDKVELLEKRLSTLEAVKSCPQRKEEGSVNMNSKLSNTAHQNGTETCKTVAKNAASWKRKQAELKMLAPKKAKKMENLILRVPSFDEAWSILEKSGCRLEPRLCKASQYPGPCVYKLNVSVDPFRRLYKLFYTQESLCNFLCQHGINDECTWDNQDRQVLRLWIRTNIIAGIKPGQAITLPGDATMDERGVWEMLKELGLFSRSDNYFKRWGGNSQEKCRKTDWHDEPGPEQDRFFSKTGPNGLYAHIARYGLQAFPKDISAKDRLALELFVAITFEENDKDWSTILPHKVGPGK